MKHRKKSKIAIFASGSGSNAENLYNYFKFHESIEVKKILTNNPNAGVIHRFKDKGIEMIIFSRDQFKQKEFLENLSDIDFIVLAGFLWLVPEFIIHHFENRIVNIHPSLLPDYGGKNMYGMKVHEAVVANKEPFSGITIHLVNNEYDKGAILFQSKVELADNETAATLSEKIHHLEYTHFPKVVEDLINKTVSC